MDSLRTKVYRKPTHTDRYLDCNTAQTLLHRAETLPNTIEEKQQERKHITDTLISNGYPRKFLEEIEKKQAMKQIG